MATGAPDAQGVWQYGEDDTLYPFSEFMNLGQQSISDQLAAIRQTLNAPWTAYVPALTASTANPVLGTGARVQGRYRVVGRTVTAWGEVTFGSASINAGNGTYYVSLPRTARTPDALTVAGHAWLYDASGAIYAAYVQIDASTGPNRCRFYPAGSGVTNVTNTVPFAWGASDGLRFNLSYETP